MEIIPVIDLKNSEVVRARKGDRANYRPIETPLARTPRPDDVVAGLLSLHPFSKLYIADLDAITGTGDNGEAIRSIRDAHPALEVWVDMGHSDAPSIRTFLARSGVHAVIGSESQQDTSALSDVGRDERVLLSIDYLKGLYAGPPELLDSPELWPARVIAMTLDRVGASQGPDLDILKAIIARAGTRRVYAAGGVRNADDLEALELAGAKGVLVASALHDGRLGERDIARFQA